uniref:GNAT family N-acetyltransferase n=1 Tax=Orrella sp. TaxID=1921583 RepID=UPI004047D21D
MLTVNIADCVAERDGLAIQSILNEAIVNSTALYDYEPRSLETVTVWLDQKTKHGWPLRGAFDASGRLIGFATFGPFRPQPAYKYTVEHSVYIDETCRGQGIGHALLTDLINQAQQRQLHVMVGCIDAANAASINLHEKLGFHHAGTIKQAGFKFGRWLDAAFYQKILSTPSHAFDG